MRLRVWSPLPPSPSGIADYVAEALPALSGQVEVQCVVESPQTVDPELRARFAVVSPPEVGPADLDLYHLGNSPGHAYVYRRALTHPGVVLLHEWSLHHLVLHETLEQGDVPSYLHEMRRAHGETGTFVGRQVARALGGDVWPALFPLNDRLLEASLGVVTLTRAIAALRRPPAREIPLAAWAIRAAGAWESLRQRLTGTARPFNADKAREVLQDDWTCDSGPLLHDLQISVSDFQPWKQGFRTLCRCYISSQVLRPSMWAV